MVTSITIFGCQLTSELSKNLAEIIHCTILLWSFLQTSVKDALAKYVEKYSVPEGDDRMRNPGPPYACPVVPAENEKVI